MKNSPFILHLSPYKAAGPGGRMRNSNPRAVIRRTNRRPSVIGLHQPETAVEFQFQSVVEGDLMVAAVAFDLDETGFAKNLQVPSRRRPRARESRRDVTGRDAAAAVVKDEEDLAALRVGEGGEHPFDVGEAFRGVA